MLYYSHKSKASGYTLYKQELQNAKNTYFNAIKSTKLAYWNKFLENKDSQSIFKAMKYTKDTIY
jgi:tRNA(Leu) C34 or U34 (ribose-2'-O)-methylase TrmL